MGKNSGFIALLRGINVSGHKKILMKDLTHLFESCGFTNIQTYIQSGNVVFNSTKSTGHDKLIHTKIKQAYGWEVPVLVQTADQISEILKNCPFDSEKQLKSYYCLMLENPTAQNIQKLSSYTFEAEEYNVLDSCIYLYYEKGAGQAKMTNNFIENKLKVICTSRNHRTLVKLVSMSTKD